MEDLKRRIVFHIRAAGAGETKGEKSNISIGRNSAKSRQGNP